MINRPDLQQASPEIKAYIEALESEIAKLRPQAKPESESIFDAEQELIRETEPETTVNLVTLTGSFYAKRTPRHLYARQRRGGMGVFDIVTPDDNPPLTLVLADEEQYLLLFTNFGRAFRIPMRQIPVGEIRCRGESISKKMELKPGEILSAALPDKAQGAVVLVSKTGMVRHLRHHIFGEYMRPGNTLLDPVKFGELAAACQTPGNRDILIATQKGRAIRFSEKLVPPQGGPGIRVQDDDKVVSVTSVNDESKLLLVDRQGNGTIRLMSAFLPNKSSGGSGKLAMKTDQLVTANEVADDADVFLLSKLSKVIRFSAGEIPPKEGVVQGVHCMSLRADAVVAGIPTT
jgi:DNA gyrase subunit A